jgi:hypothetical protein
MTRPILMAACVIFGLTHESRAQPPLPAKVALVCSQELEAARNVRDLALAKLGADANIALLDRATIERLLGEQKLSLSGLVDAATAVRAGRILAVDLFAMVEYSLEAKQNAGIVVFDAATGVKLADSGFRDAALEPQAMHVVDTVRAAASKWRAGTKNLKTLCFLPVRNADLPRGMDRYCETLSAMLERDVLGFDSTALLERKRLDLVNKEKTLAQEAATRELLASLIVLEMEVSRGKDGKGIRAAVILRDNAGKELRRIIHEVDDPNGTGLLAPLSEKIRQGLQIAAASAPTNRSRESQRFLREARLLWTHKHYAQGLQAAEAAYALDPSGDARKLLAEYLMCFATDLIHPGGMRSVGYGLKLNVTPQTLREALDLSRRGLQLMEACRAPGRMTNEWVSVTVKLDPFAVGDARRILFNKIPLVVISPADAEAQQEFDDFREFCLQGLVDQCIETARDPVPDAKTLDRLAFMIERSTTHIREAAPSRTAFTRTMHSLALKWLDIAQTIEPESIAVNTAAKFGEILRTVYFPNMLPGKTSADAPLAALERARRFPHPLVRLAAEHNDTRLMFSLGKLPYEDAAARHRELLAEGKRLIDNPTFAPHDKYRVALYRLLNGAISHAYLHKKGADVMQEHFELCDFMLARGDVVEGVIGPAVATWPSTDRQINIQALRIIDSALDVTDSPKRRHFADSVERFKIQMREARRGVLSRVPDLQKVVLPWESVKPLIAKEEWSKLNATLIVAAMIHDKHIYYFTGGEDPASKHRLLQLLRVPVDGGPSTLLGKTLVAVDKPPPPSSHYVFWINPTFVSSTAFAHGNLYAGTVSEGVFVFPLEGGPPARIGEKEGLPSQSVRNLAIVDNTLIAALDGGYLVTRDLMTGRTETIASSRRAEKLSPFDNDGPLYLEDLVADAKRQRVLFRLPLHFATGAKAGLWEFNVASRQFKKLQPVVVGNWSPIIDDRIYLQQFHGLERDAGGLVAYDLAANEYMLVYGKAAKEYGALKSIEMPADLSIPFARHLLHGGHYWSVYPFGRRSLDGQSQDFYPSLLDQTWTYAFSARVSLQAVSPTELLIGDLSGLYLVRLKAQ